MAFLREEFIIMDSRRNERNVNDDDSEAEKIQDNGQLSRESEQKDEMDENGPKSLIMEIYPWLSQFKKMCRNSLTQRSASSLMSLMTYYARNSRSSVNECHTKPLRAEKLRDSIADTLIFFLYYYRDVKDETKDRDDYMILMSDLLAMYIDMELKASKKGNEHSSKISARLSSCLHIYLENSSEYLLDTLLKVHFMNHNYQEILDPVITRIFKSIEDHPSSSTMYARYLLVYRLWKKLNKDVAIRNQINMIAISSLGVAPTDFSPFIVDSVLPKVPMNQKITTKLMLVQKFELEKSCEEFLNFCKRERESRSSRKDEESCLSSKTSLPEDNNDFRDSVTNNNFPNVSTNVVSSICNTSTNLDSSSLNNHENSIRPSVEKSKIKSSSLSSRRFKKSNEIVIIDLTSDIVAEKVIKKKTSRRKLIWLEEAKKRISMKNTLKMDPPMDEEISQPEDSSLDIRALRISSPSKICTSKMEIPLDNCIIGNEEEKNVPSSGSPSNEEPSNSACTFPNDLIKKSHNFVEWSELEKQENERNRTERESITKNSEMLPCLQQTLTIREDTFVTDNSDRSTSCENFNDPGESLPEVATSQTETPGTLEEPITEPPKDKTLLAHHVPVLQTAIKPDCSNDRSNEIIDETPVYSHLESKSIDYPSKVAQKIPVESLSQHPPSVIVRKIRENHYQENIDGLSLLASVSQSVSQLNLTNSANNVELIKVKNYASMVEVTEEPDTSSDHRPYEPTSEMINRIVGIYPEDEIDKVAYQVEVTSTEEIDSCANGNCNETNSDESYSQNVETLCINTQTSSVPPSAENSASLTEKDDTNVILNGETVVLFQKSPNSNLYIINKAVENRDHANDEPVPSVLRDINEHVINDSGPFTYEMYDSMYRNQASSYDLSQYSRELANQDSRRVKKVTIDQKIDSNETCDSTESTKSVKDVASEKVSPKRKNSGNLSMSRRRRIKQEYNGCTNNIANHLKANYGISDCPQERVDPNHSIHIPVATSMYGKYPTATEIYIPCHKNCNSMTCALSVNPPPAIHSHSGKNSSAPNATHCSCLNCTYGIMTHCSECIMPNGDTPIDPNSYYLPLHASVQNSNVKDLTRTSVDDQYEDQLLCKLDRSTIKPLDNVDFKREPREVFRAELDNKLPLKKRFKAMMAMSFNEMPIKCEKIQSYPSTPMLSIAALEAQKNEIKNNSKDPTNCSDLGSKSARLESNESSREMIRRDYRKDMMMSPPITLPTLTNGYRSGEQTQKRKRKATGNSIEANYENIGKIKRTETPTKSQARPSEKVHKEPENPTAMTTKKKSVRQTRSSKRNLPKVNYIYTDGDSDWNPSGGNCGVAGSKRKRKSKTSR